MVPFILKWCYGKERGAEGPGFLNPKTPDKKINFPEPGTPERPRSKPGPSPAFCSGF